MTKSHTFVVVGISQGACIMSKSQRVRVKSMNCAQAMYIGPTHMYTTSPYMYIGPLCMYRSIIFVSRTANVFQKAFENVCWWIKVGLEAVSLKLEHKLVHQSWTQGNKFEAWKRVSIMSKFMKQNALSFCWKVEWLEYQRRSTEPCQSLDRGCMLRIRVAHLNVQDKGSPSKCLHN